MKIIAVDDDQISLDMLSDCIRGGEFEDITLMTSPVEAFEAIRDSSVAFDCILLDVEMPELSGIDLCADIRNLPRYGHTPILMITRRKDHAAVERAFANGATDYITKPFEFFEVQTRIRLAERLVQERRAAIDSYAAVQTAARRAPLKTFSRGARQPKPARGVDLQELTGEDLLSLSVFQNYLEQVTRADFCEINLLAIKIRHIDQIFAHTPPIEFVGFLRMVATVIDDEFKPEKAFLTHIGNGAFLCATRGISNLDLSAAETGILHILNQHELPGTFRTRVPLEIVVGTPLVLTTTPKLNFRRALKAATARVEKREADLYHSGPAVYRG